MRFAAKFLSEQKNCGHQQISAWGWKLPLDAPCFEGGYADKVAYKTPSTPSIEIRIVHVCAPGRDF